MSPQARVGLIYGLILAVLTVARTMFWPTANYGAATPSLILFAIAVVIYFLAGLHAGRLTHRAAPAVTAGLWAGVTNGLAGGIPVVLLTMNTKAYLTQMNVLPPSMTTGASGLGLYVAAVVGGLFADIFLGIVLGFAGGLFGRGARMVSH